MIRKILYYFVCILFGTYSLVCSFTFFGMIMLYTSLLLRFNQYNIMDFMNCILGIMVCLVHTMLMEMGYEELVLNRKKFINANN